MQPLVNVLVPVIQSLYVIGKSIVVDDTSFRVIPILDPSLRFRLVCCFGSICILEETRAPFGFRKFGESFFLTCLSEKMKQKLVLK